MKKLIIIGAITLLIISGGSVFANLQTGSNIIDNSDGLIGYWPMTISGTTVFDKSGQGNDGTNNGAIPVAGKIGQAMEFDGVDDNVNMGVTTYSIANAYTLSAWIKTTDTSKQLIVMDTADRLFQFRMNGALLNLIRFDSGHNTVTNVSSTGSINDGNWHFVVATFNSSVGSKLYIDGSEDGTDGDTTPNNTVGTLLIIGNRTTSFFNGEIDEVRIYDRALSPQEIKNLYNQSKAELKTQSNSKGLIGHWPLSQDAETQEEIQGADLIAGWDFEVGWASVNVTIDGYGSFTKTAVGVNGGVKKDLVTVGKKYRMVIMGMVDSAGGIYNSAETATYTTFPEGLMDNITFDFTASGDNGIYIRMTGADEGDMMFVMTLELYELQLQTADVTPFGNNGTITAGASDGFVTDRKGQPAKAYDFNRADTKIDIGTDMIGVGANSFSAWIYLNSYGEGNEFGRILDNGKTIFRSSNDANETLIFQSDGSTSVNSGIGTLLLNTWYHVVVTRNSAGDETNFYINGVLSGDPNQNSGTPEIGDTNVFIGNREAGDVTFDGKISDVRIYDRVLSQPEITQLYEQYKPGLKIQTLSKGLIGHWSLAQEDLKSSVIFGDLTPQGNDGTSTNTPNFITDRKGQPNKAMTFNGSSDVIDTGTGVSTSISSTNKLSASSWVKTVSTDYEIWLSVGSAQYWGAHFTDDTLKFTIDTSIGGREDLDFVNSGLGDGEWHHIVNTYDGAYMRMYMDGEEVASVEKTGTISVSANALIGEFTGAVFTGSISDVRIYDRVLSAQEVKMLYENYN